MKKILFVVMLFSSTASAQRIAEGPLNLTRRANQGGKLLDAATLAADRSFTISTSGARGYGLLTLYISLTWDAASAVALTCTGSNDGNTTDYALQSCSVASGACTSSDASWSKAVTASKKWIWRVDVEGIEDIECTFTDTGGGASDTLTVYGQFAVKGG
jgi:hypothetical protein